jgi:hypothetical protein
MSTHRYPAKALRADYLRSAAGFAITAGLLPFGIGEPISASVMGGGALLFLAFGLRTRLRQAIAIELDDEGISTSGRRRVSLPWRGLTRLSLRYYATKRDRTGGWMQLKLAAGRKQLTLESTLEGFLEVVRRALAAARANELALDAATWENLVALGLGGSPTPHLSSSRDH